jgi:hypothetical protein
MEIITGQSSISKSNRSDFLVPFQSARKGEVREFQVDDSAVPRLGGGLGGMDEKGPHEKSRTARNIARDRRLGVAEFVQRV